MSEFSNPLLHLGCQLYLCLFIFNGAMTSLLPERKPELTLAENLFEDTGEKQ